MPVRKAKARWEGPIKEGTGRVSFESGVEQPYSFASRFEGGEGMNPEEMIGAAEASCLAMATSKALGEAGHAVDHVEVEARVNLDMESGPTISRIDLELRAKVEGLDEAGLKRIAEEAKESCPVSRALAATQLGLKTSLAP